jgi:ubiquinone/menaquinone biosynthesis C-methylase UbiE
MRLRDAVKMIEGSDLAPIGPGAWADLGCGDGTFTLALAEVTAPGSVIHAMDRDSRALAQIAARHNDVRVETHLGDFTKMPWPFTDLNGILMANSLHYVQDQEAFITSCRAQMQPEHRFLIVEYDTDQANAWVPHPIGRSALAELFVALGYESITPLGSRPSAYRRAELYAAMITTSPRTTVSKIFEN